MRKYFLLSAVALLVTSTANATTDYAEVTAKASIEVAGTMNCSDLDFGTIVVKQNNAISTYDSSTGETTGDILSITNDDTYKISCDDPIDETYKFISSLELSSPGKTKKLTVNLINGDEIYAMLTIPANIEAGEYTNSFTITRTY